MPRCIASFQSIVSDFGLFVAHAEIIVCQALSLPTPTAIPITRQTFLAIISSSPLAVALTKEVTAIADGLVTKPPTAGRHDAPVTGQFHLNDGDEAICKGRDREDLAKVLSSHRPSWLTGGHTSVDGLSEVLKMGTIFNYQLVIPMRKSLPHDTRNQRSLFGESVKDNCASNGHHLPAFSAHRFRVCGVTCEKDTCADEILKTAGAPDDDRLIGLISAELPAESPHVEKRSWKAHCTRRSSSMRGGPHLDLAKVCLPFRDVWMRRVLGDIEKCLPKRKTRAAPEHSANCPERPTEMGGQSRAPHASDSTRNPATATISLLSGKWTTEIILALAVGKQRFAALQRLLPGISHRILTKELKALQTSGIVFRKVYPTIPPSVEYGLSDSGFGLCKVLDAASEWATHYLGERPPST